MNNGSRMPLLEDDNWPEWSAKARFLLKKEKCWSAVKAVAEATHDPQPEETSVTDTPAPVEMAAEDELATALMGLHLAPQHLALAEKAVSAAALWRQLRTKFTNRVHARKAELQRALVLLKQHDGELVTAYLERAEQIRRHLALVGTEVTDDQLARAALAGLGEHLEAAGDVLVNGTAVLVWSTVAARLLGAEERLNARAAAKGKPPPGTAFKATTTTTPRPFRGECYLCGKKGYKAHQCPVAKTINLQALGQAARWHS